MREEELMEDRDVERIVRSALGAGVLAAGPHPDPDTLFRYHARELSDDDADAVQNHLAHCPACTEAVLDFGAFPQLDSLSDEDIPSAEETEAGWADLQARLGRQPFAFSRGAVATPERTPRPRGAVVVPLPVRDQSPTSPRRPASRSLAAHHALAAVLLAGIVGLTAYGLRVRRQALRPEPVTIVSLTSLADASTRGALPDRRPLPVGTAQRVVLVLPLASRAQYEPYTVVLYERARPEHEVLRVGSLHYSSSNGGLALSVLREDLPAGECRARVLDARGQEVGYYGGRLAFQ